MTTTLGKSALCITVLTTVFLVCGVATAQPYGRSSERHDGYNRDDRPDRRGEARRERDDRGRRDGGRLTPRQGAYFADRHRGHVREYFGHQYRRGCPPGLTRNRARGCVAYNQNRRWQIGRPIPRDVVYYDLPPTLVTQISAPPPGYRYARVASDILLIALGTGIVVDAIQDLGR